jgi:hypothetical protein
MKKRIMAIASALALIIMLSRAQPLQASWPDTEERYDVYYTDVCLVGPCRPNPPPELEGHWLLACDGSFTGWGWQPDEYPAFSYTVVTDGHSCDNGGPPEI